MGTIIWKGDVNLHGVLCAKDGRGQALDPASCQEGGEDAGREH